LIGYIGDKGLVWGGEKSWRGVSGSRDMKREWDGEEYSISSNSDGFEISTPSNTFSTSHFSFPSPHKFEIEISHSGSEEKKVVKGVYFVTGGVDGWRDETKVDIWTPGCHHSLTLPPLVSSSASSDDSSSGICYLISSNKHLMDLLYRTTVFSNAWKGDQGAQEGRGISGRGGCHCGCGGNEDGACDQISNQCSFLSFVPFCSLICCLIGSC